MICHMIQTAKQKSPTQIPKQPKTPMELRSQSLIMRPWLRYRARHQDRFYTCKVGFETTRPTRSYQPEAKSVNRADVLNGLKPGTRARCRRCIDTELPDLGWWSMRLTLAFGTLVLLNSAFAWADRAPSDEEPIAPLVAAQGCWGGGCRCSDAQKYHLEFDSDLKLIAKRLVR